MPRETIYNTAPLGHAEGETPPVLATTVTWGRDQSTVQIATVDESVDQFSPGAGWYMLLDRQQINRLINTLRRARDAAYGKDA